MDTFKISKGQAGSKKKKNGDEDLGLMGMSHGFLIFEDEFLLLV